MSMVAGGLELSSISAAFMLGLLSAPHCVAMCGGISSALLMGGRSRQIRGSDTALIASSGGALTEAMTAAGALNRANGGGRFALAGDALLYGSGKILGYMALGTVAGLGGLLMGGIHGSGFMLLRTLSGLLMVALGLYIAGWWLGVSQLERLAYRFWQPLLRQFQKLSLARPGNKLLAGACWGLLPCGIVYSVLTMAMASGSAVGGMVLMLAFGLGTLPFVLLSGGLMQSIMPLLRNAWLRQLCGLLMIALGVTTILNTL